jgi:hypothetical protein
MEQAAVMDMHNCYLALASVAVAALIILLFSLHVTLARDLGQQPGRHDARVSMHTVFSCRTKPTMFWCHR